VVKQNVKKMNDLCTYCRKPGADIFFSDSFNWIKNGLYHKGDGNYLTSCIWKAKNDKVREHRRKKYLKLQKI
jgi:hypothetical protein